MTLPVSENSDTTPILGPVLGVVLAGGQSRRMGGQDKSSLYYAGQTLLEHVIERAAPQVERLLINTNRPAELPPSVRARYAVVPDEQPSFPGPLAGIEAAMHWAQQQEKPFTWLATFATDTPFVPCDFVQRCARQLAHSGAKAGYACHRVYESGCHGHSAECRTQPHYAMALWHLSVLPQLQQRLAAGQASLKGVMSDCGGQAIEFGDAQDAPNQDPFFNINTPEDWLLAQRYLGNL